MQFIYDDGGRAVAGYKGFTGDCVCRSITIAGRFSYLDVYNRLAEGNYSQRNVRKARGYKKAKTAAHGIWTKRLWFKDLMHDLGFKWTPTMFIGQGCKVHLADGELPMGRLVVSLSRHYTAVIDGVIHDTHDPQREPTEWIEHGLGDKRRTITIGGRCVYGYWEKA